MARKTYITGLGLFFIATVLCSAAFANSTLSWQAVPGTVTGYRIYYGTTHATYTGSKDVGNVTQYSLANLSLTQGMTYYFVVRAYNSAGESANSNEVSWIVPDTTPPMPPISVAIQNGGSTLTWAANNETDLKEYRVYYGTTAGSYSPFIPVGKVTSYTVPNLHSGTRYYFALTSVDTSGNESTYSTVVSSTISDSQAPVMTISTPTTAATYTATTNIINLSGTASDNVGVTAVTWVNSLGGSGTASGTINWTIANVNLISGDNRITVQAKDGAGNSSQKILTVTYIPPVVTDTTAPALAITAPTSNTTYSTNSTSINISGTASDNIGVTQVSWSNSTGGSGQATGTNSWSVANIALKEGSNGITVTARDAAGNTAQKMLTVTYAVLDTTAPTISITSPSSSGAYQTSVATINLAGSASDNKAVSQVRWSNDKGGSGIAVGTATWTISGAALLEGTNTIKVTAVDAAGNQGSSSIAVTYTVPDTTAPVVSIASPSSNGAYQTNIATLNLAGTASDNKSVSQVRWSNDRGGSGIAVGTTSWTISGLALAEGTNKISIGASDAAGNTGSSVITVTYTPPDTVDPTITIIAPTTAGTYATNSALVNISGNASDNVGVTQVRWSNSRGGSGIATGTQNWSITGINLLEGQNVIGVSAVDAAGNSAIRNLTVTYTLPDTTKPIVAIVTPTTSAAYATTTALINLAGTAGDNVGVTQVAWKNSRGGEGIATGTTSWNISNINLAQGENILTISANDKAGNIGSAVITITYTLPDTTPPVIKRTSPTSSSYYATKKVSIAVAGTASDNVGVKVVKWSNSRGGSGIAQGTTSWSIPGINLTRGSNTITITAQDNAGNQTINILTVSRF